MIPTYHQVLVLWGQGFDELAASIFISELRQLGIRVKVVGLNMQQNTGQHGLALVPDLTLDKALRTAKRSCCIIVPATWAALQQFNYDPRLTKLLYIAMNNQALVLVAPPQPPQPANQQKQELRLPTLTLLEYPDVEDLMTFVRKVLILWLTKAPPAQVNKS